MFRAPRLALMFFLFTFVGGLSSASCLPDPHDLVGRPCDADHACGEEALACCQGTCQRVASEALCNEPVPPGASDGGTPDGGDAGPVPDAGPSCPPDLLRYGGFEQSSDVGHFDHTGAATFTQSPDAVHSGQYGLHVVWDPSDSDDYYGVTVHDDVLTGLTVGTRYCASAWVKRGAVQGEMRLITRHHSDSTSHDIYIARVIAPDDEWFLILNDQAYLEAPYTRSINFRTSVTPSAGKEYSVDDMRFWESENGVCDPRCAR